MTDLNQEGLRILLIDDTPDDRALAIRELKRAFNAVTVTEIRDAASLRPVEESCAFDLVITDYRLGWTDGLTLLHELKTHCPDRPVIMFTNSGNEELAVEAMKAGLDDYVVKSSKGFVGLAVAIRQALERQDSRRTIARTAQELRALNESLEALVKERTAELEAAKASLEAELAERKRMEKLLLRSHDFYLTLLEEFPTLIWRAGIDGKCDYFNKAWLRFRGRSLEEELKEGYLCGMHPLDQEGYGQVFQQAYQRRKRFQVEYRLRRHDGEYRWMSDSGAPFNDLEGHFAGYIGSCYDIHDGKRLREDLERIVEKRTRDLGKMNNDLHDKIRELEQFQDVVVGRELKMIALEKEVAALRARLDTPKEVGRQPEP